MTSPGTASGEYPARDGLEGSLDGAGRGVAEAMGIMTADATNSAMTATDSFFTSFPSYRTYSECPIRPFRRKYALLEDPRGTGLEGFEKLDFSLGLV